VKKDFQNIHFFNAVISLRQFFGLSWMNHLQNWKIKIAKKVIFFRTNPPPTSLFGKTRTVNLFPPVVTVDTPTQYKREYCVRCYTSYLIKKKDILHRFHGIALAGDFSHTTMSKRRNSKKDFSRTACTSSVITVRVKFESNFRLHTELWGRGEYWL